MALVLGCALSLALLPATAQAQTPTVTPGTPDSPETHIVQFGETLSEIAKQHGFTLSQLMRVNGIPNSDAIYTGQVLRFPIIDRPPGVTIHVVEPGEALSRIAQRYGVELRALMDANNIRNPDGIVTGQELVIPGPDGATPTPESTSQSTPVTTPAATPVPAVTATTAPTEPPTAAPTEPPTPAPAAAPVNGPTTHTVRPGETASEIAKQYGVNLTDMLRLNGIANANLIRSGAELLIPASALGQTPTPTLDGEPQVELVGEPEVEMEPSPMESGFAGSTPQGDGATPEPMSEPIERDNGSNRGANQRAGHGHPNAHIRAPARAAGGVA